MNKRQTVRYSRLRAAYSYNGVNEKTIAATYREKTRDVIAAVRAAVTLVKSSRRL